MTIPIPAVQKSEDLGACFTALTAAMAGGEITPDEASVIAGVLKGRRPAIESIEIYPRLQVLEQAAEARK